MPKQKEMLTPKDQSGRFKRDAQRMIDAGELNPIEADAAMDKLVRTGAANKH